ncbi:MAG: choice-of-anchor T family protein [Thermoplasmatota archaeon]
MEENRRRSAPLLAMVILTASFFVAPNMPSTAEVKGIGSPPFFIDLNESKQDAYVAPGQDGIVVFHGYIHYEQHQNMSVNFILHTYCNGWETTIPGPFSAVLNRSHQIPFQVTIKVPTRTSQRGWGRLSVHCRFEYVGSNLSGQLVPAMGTIFIRPYYDCRASPRNLNVSIHRDDDSRILLNLTNTANCDLRIRVDIAHRKELEDRGIFCILYRDKIPLKEGNFTPFRIDIHTTMDTELGDHEVLIRFVYGQSTWGEEYREAVINVSVLEQELFGVPLSIWVILEGVLIGVIGIIIANATIIRDIKKRIL